MQLTSGAAVPVRRDAHLAFQRTLGVEVPWDQPGLTRSERVIRFLEDLTIGSGKDAGTKLRLRPFQLKFIRAVYREDKTGRRPVRTAVFSLPRKQGKSFLAAGLAVCHLCGPEKEPRGEVYSCASDRFQASKIFHEMFAIISAHPWLSARTKVQHFHKTIYDLETGSMYAALSREASTKMGLNPSFVVYDEFGQAPDDELYGAMDSAMSARKAPLLLTISTQAADDAAPFSRLIDDWVENQIRRHYSQEFSLVGYTTLIMTTTGGGAGGRRSKRTCARQAVAALGGHGALPDGMRLEVCLWVGIQKSQNSFTFK